VTSGVIQTSSDEEPAIIVYESEGEMSYDAGGVHWVVFQETMNESSIFSAYIITGNSTGLSIEAKYNRTTYLNPRTSINDHAQDNKTENLELRVTISTIIEYVDVDRNGVFDEVSDAVIQTIPVIPSSRIDFFDNFEYSEMNEVPYVVTFVNTTDHDFFDIIIHVTEDSWSVSGVELTPLQLKIDYLLTDFPYMNDSSDLAIHVDYDSGQAVETLLQNETQDEQDNRSQNELGLVSSLNDMKDTIKGFFSWSEHAEVDGFTVPVNYTYIAENGQEVIFSYPRGTRILHDPKLGFEGKFPPILEAISDLVENFLDLVGLSSGGYFMAMVVVTIVSIGSLIVHSRWKTVKLSRSNE
jgi:hypothetical protein